MLVTLSRKGEIFLTSHVQISSVFLLLKWIKSLKEVIYEKNRWNHRLLKRVNCRRSLRILCQAIHV